jgi:AmmeMemoRadiSam system protein A
MTSGSSIRSLDHDDRQFLLGLARQTLEARFADRSLPSPTAISSVLYERRGAFVTLTIDGQLRGCIGHIVGVEELWRAVRSNALAAAFEDPRFPPLHEDELAQVLIEISALTPLRQVDPADVVVGRDGVLITRGSFRGVLLPQVAIEQGWDRETFLDRTCRKAGLDSACWQDPETSVSTFTAEVFREG